MRALPLRAVGHGVAAALEGVRDLLAFGDRLDGAGEDVDEAVANPCGGVSLASNLVGMACTHR